MSQCAPSVWTRAVRLPPLPPGARPLPDRGHRGHRAGAGGSRLPPPAQAVRADHRVVHVDLPRPAPRRVPPRLHVGQLAGDRTERGVLRQRARRRPGRPLLALRQGGRRPLRRDRLGARAVHGQPDPRRASGRGSTARSSRCTTSATTGSSSGGCRSSTTPTPGRTPWSSSGGRSAGTPRLAPEPWAAAWPGGWPPSCSASCCSWPASPSGPIGAGRRTRPRWARRPGPSPCCRGSRCSSARSSSPAWPGRPRLRSPALVLLAFTGLLILNLARGRRPPCACFGASSRRPIGPGSLVRNLVLLALAVIAFVA